MKTLCGNSNMRHPSFYRFVYIPDHVFLSLCQNGHKTKLKKNKDMLLLIYFAWSEKYVTKIPAVLSSGKHVRVMYTPYIAKMGHAGVYLIFLFLLQNIECGYSARRF